MDDKLHGLSTLWDYRLRGLRFWLGSHVLSLLNLLFQTLESVPLGLRHTGPRLLDGSLKVKLILRQMLMSQAVKERVPDSNASESVLAVLECPLSCLFNSLLYGFFTGRV